MVEQQQQQAQQLLFHHHQPQAAAAPRPRLGSSRLGGGVRGSGVMGEIVEVQGGHIVRSTGRKDRHSKVCTAKGPRDRRVRLSAHTAIQFYDVQDRLGYDRPSKAVDWLIKNAKAAIDELAELPPWRPTATAGATSAPQSDSSLPSLPSLPDNTQGLPSHSDAANHIPDSTGKRVVEPAAGASSPPPPAAAYGYGGSSSFLPPSLESDSIADTFKFFFPTVPSSSSPSIAFQSYAPDLLSRSSGSHAQDLRLSLQSFQDQTSFLHQPSPAATAAAAHHQQVNHTSAEHVLFSSSSSASLAFDATTASWSEQTPRIASWNATDTVGGNSSGTGGYLFGMMQPQQQLPQGVPLHQVVGQGPFFTSQRGPLQSNIPHPARAWNDPTAAAAAAADHAGGGGHTTAMHQQQLGPSDPAIGFNPGGFSAFRIPARIHGDEEQQHIGVSTKPPSNSPGSHR